MNLFMRLFAETFCLENRRQRRAITALESADEGEVEAMSCKALARQLIWCREKVPYYRDYLEKWQSDAIRSDPRTVLRTLPILDKHEIRAHHNRLTAKDTNRSGVRVNTSGGSTGEPIQILQDRNYRRWNRATSIVFETWAGYRPGQRKFILWGMPRDLADGRRPLTRLKNRMLNRHLLDAYRMSPAAMDDYLDEIEARQPALLRCLAQSGAELARHALRRDRVIQGIGAVVSTGGVLHKAERQAMAEAFNAPVFDIYGSREVGPIACESASGEAKLINPLVHHIEILDQQNRPVAPEEPGDIVITLLTNRIMPLLRYRIGDRGRWARNSHGKPAWPALSAIDGRVMSHFVAEDGALVNGEYFTHLMFQQTWVRQFQWVQSTLKNIELKVVTDDPDPAGDRLAASREALEQKCRDVLGPDARLELQVVEQIDPSPSGKHHYTISNVPWAEH